MLDDDMQLCRMIQTFFEREGWMFRSFHTARMFELALLDSRPDVAILDLMLPGKTGLELLEGLRLSGFRFPVLMLSAMGSPSDRVVGLEAGANDYMAKPFLCRELHLRILKMLDCSKMEPTATKPSHPAAASYQWGRVVFEVDSRRLVCDELSKSLSRGDAALLEALCTASGPISRQELLSASGSLVDTPESRTIDVRIFRLRRVLKELNDGNDLIVTIRGKGYQLTQLPLAIPRPE
jgi:DNA-binding response OmpR family regulator